jgi:hypothetical protein
MSEGEGEKGRPGDRVKGRMGEESCASEERIFVTSSWNFLQESFINYTKSHEGYTKIHEDYMQINDFLRQPG